MATYIYLWWQDQAPIYGNHESEPVADTSAGQDSGVDWQTTAQTDDPADEQG